MSFVLLGILNSQASGGAQSYFLSALEKTSSFEWFPYNTVDSNDSVITGRITNLVSMALDGSLNYTKSLSGTSVAIENMDSAGADVGLIIDDSSNDGGIVMKIDSSANITWQRGFSMSGALDTTPSNITSDSTGAFYATGFSFRPDGNSTLDDEVFVSKHDSSGTFQWMRSFGGSSGQRGVDIVSDSSDNVYITGINSNTGQPMLFKYSSLGTLQFQKEITNSAGSSFMEDNALAVDSNDNIFLAVKDSNLGYGRGLLVKINSSGVVQWDKSFVDSAGLNTSIWGVGVDSSDNVFVSTERSIVGGRFQGIAKLDSSGNVLYQRRVKPSSADNEGTGQITPDSNGDIWATGRLGFSGDADGTIYHLPGDGSSTGSIVLNGVTVAYEADNMTISTPGLFSSSNTSLQTDTRTNASFTPTTSLANDTYTLYLEEL